MCVCVREMITLLSACKQLYSTSASITPLFNSNHILTRLQCHATTGPSIWLYKDSDVKLLPSNITKRTIWDLYCQAAAGSVMRVVAYSTFTQLWHQLLPYIVVMKAMSDLCWVCQQNSTAITCAANRPEDGTFSPLPPTITATSQHHTYLCPLQF